MPPPRATAIRLRLRNTLLAQRNGRKKALQQQQQQKQQRNNWNMWVSTNKVLIGSVGGLKKAHFRNPNFECDETKLLIQLWGDPQVQRTLITTHKKHPVIAKLAEKMREYGYNRSTEEINTRIKNLKCFYNRIKKDLELGTINEPSWKHFQAMDEILTRPVFGNSNAVQRPAEPGTSGGQGTGRAGRQPGGGSPGPGELSDDPDDQIEVKLELVSDDDKELRPEELLKNAEQVELKEPNLLIPKDEPTEEDGDDPNDPDFEHDGGSETDDESSGMDEADESERSTRLRRRTKRVHKTSKSNAPNADGPSTSGNADKGQGAVVSSVASTTTAPPLPRAIKIMNYPGGGSFLKFTSVASVAGSGTSSTATATTVGITTLAGSSGSVTTTPSSKISLVPTNFLLKPQASNNIGFKQPIQLYTKPTVTIASSNPTTGLQPVVSVSGTTSAGAPGTPGTPMKLLLVNTLPKDGSAPKQQLINPATKQIYTTSTGVPLQKVTGLPGSLTIQPQQLLPKPGPGLPAVRKLLPATVGAPRAAPSATGGPPKLGGFKALLGQLVSLQRENLCITRTRQLTEKQRFANEKSVANSLLDALGELNRLLMDGTAELLQAEPKADEGGMHIQISNVRHEPSLHRANNERTVQPSSRPALQPVIDDESVKAEVISDSEEG
uniref:Myb/SANT-like DNA-binding domain-containing protein n=1 Tax=Anopheles atroparvus TaxID=41427 RepID=A0AAG5DNZ5_ANOAO